jgi:thioesterase domain-containing protein/acyl carrier protein
MSRRIFIADISWRLGASVALETLSGEGIVEGLRARGFGSFCRFRGDRDHAWTDCVTQTMSMSRARGVAVDTVVLAGERVDPGVERRRLVDCGLEEAWLIGLGLQQCAAVGGAIRLAGSLLQSGKSAGGVLVVVSGAVDDEARRVSPGGDLLFSDGVASCVVNSIGGELELLCVINHAMSELNDEDPPGGSARRLRRLHGGMKAAFKAALDGAGLTADAIAHVHATNAGSFGHTMVASAGSFTPAALAAAAAGLTRRGHVFACDELIGVGEGLASETIRPGETAFLVGWSPALVSACVVRAVDSGRPTSAGHRSVVALEPTAPGSEGWVKDFSDADRGYVAPVGPTEERLARLWAQLLKVDRIDRRDNFFDLGGNSLLGLRLMFEINRAFGKRAPLRLLLSAPTIAGLAHQLLQETAAGPVSLVPLQAGGQGAPIFMIHWIERDLARRLGGRRPVYGLSFGLAATGGDGDLPPPDGIAAVALHYIEEMQAAQPRGPYNLIGHSAGGLIAFEMARRLSEAGEAVAFLGLLDTHPARAASGGPLPLRRRVLRKVVATPVGDLVRLAVQRVSTSIEHALFSHRATMALLPQASLLRLKLLRMISAPYEPDPYSGSVHLFVSTAPQRGIRSEPAPPSEAGWRRWVLGDLMVHHLPGGHMDLVKDPMAAFAAEAIEQAMSGAQDVQVAGAQ